MSEPAPTFANDQLSKAYDSMDNRLSQTELQLEQEKIKLERERLALERERLEASRERLEKSHGLTADSSGKLTVPLSTLILVSIIFTLLGGILGALSTSTHLARRNTHRLQEVMQSLAVASVEDEATTNGVDAAHSTLPPWLKVMTPQRAYSGVSVLVVQ